MSEPGGDLLRALPLRTLEAATGLALGLDDTPTYIVSRSDADPLEALIVATAEVLDRGPTSSVSRRP